jgi:hypothetical protein
MDAVEKFRLAGLAALDPAERLWQALNAASRQPAEDLSREWEALWCPKRGQHPNGAEFTEAEEAEVWRRAREAQAAHDQRRWAATELAAVARPRSFVIW